MNTELRAQADLPPLVSNLPAVAIPPPVTTLSALYFTVTLYSHCFVLTKLSPRAHSILTKFIEQYIQYGLVKDGRYFVKAPMKVFASRVLKGAEYRFHIEQWPYLQSYLSNLQILPHTYEVQVADLYEAVEVSMQTLPKWEVRDYQVPIIEYLTSEKPSRIKLVEIQTGSGKTFSAMKAATLLHYRTLIILKPAFISKWTSDVKELCGLTGDDVRVVQGTPDLQKLFRDASNRRFHPQVIIMSSRTLQRWYQQYEQLGVLTLKKGYSCLPQEMMQYLRIGLRIIDEVHLDFHLHFKIDLYTHVKWSISLSATLKSDDAFLNRMYELAYPKEKRFAGIPYNKFIHAYAWFYQFRVPKTIQTSEWGSSTYSHHAFEKSIRRSRLLQEDYFEMINKAVREFYFVGYQPGNRLLIYCSSVELCTLLVNYLRNIHPSFDIRRYVEEDPYENLMKADISVSTLLSAGTGHDIAGLTAVIMTTAIRSSQSNIQGFGRLRNLPGKEMKFCYFVCTDLPKHVTYHETKKDILANMAKTYTTRHYPKELG